MIRQPPAPDSPTVTVYFGDETESPDVGMVRVDVPAGAGMPTHKHSGSDVILTPISGFVRVVKGEESVDVHVGDAVYITRDEAVSLANPGTQPARLIVAAGPANFVAGIRAWPDPQRG
ncbi:cupin domain-containing protein [Spelaeicoccus albus]|uniref:Quercetin dioxygenase-like cupin family protein n=1 Tax=Spelaeicoccus albus TaxID=1280376 RepID=A0A7Z0D168_9MICO|nr:cupin domain-containing protein [Spelaeicoccus albus]NYI66443.1 quercetin dioxygenase-like cupin family protein [Spelaeicoccus albus]